MDITKLTQVQLEAAQQASMLRVEKSVAKTDAKLPMVTTLADVNIPYKAPNAAAPLNIPTAAEGQGQPTHPSVVYFPEGWRGWRYWMAHTPFPLGEDSAENPNIVVSQDGITWQEPSGIVNPIFPKPVKGYYSDVDLVYHPGEDKLYLFWRLVENSWVDEFILVSSSSDGVNWSAKRTTLHDTKYMLSPSVVYDGDKWHMWYVGADNIKVPIESKDATIRYRTSSSPYGPWSDAVNTNMSGLFLRNNDVGAWHIDVNKYDDEYHMLINSSNFDLYLATSRDGVSWSFNKMNPILTKSGLTSGKFDASRIYRSTGILATDGAGYRYKLWYGAVDTTNTWKVGYTEMVMGPPSMNITPAKASESAMMLEGRTDQEAPILKANARSSTGRIIQLTHNNQERLSFELGKGLQIPNADNHVLVGSETGPKGRFVSTSGAVFIQAGISAADAAAVLRISRYLSTANIKSLEIFADTTLAKGDVELDNAAKGVIMKSPDGSRWRVQVGDDGVLKTTKL